MIAFAGGAISPGSNGTVRTGLGSGFGGCLRYLAEGRLDNPTPDRADAWGFQNLAAEDHRTAAVEMALTAQQAPRVENPVYHFGISLEAGETLDAAQWQRVVDRFLLDLGLEGHQAVWALHNDSAHQHAHVVANRVRLTPDGGKPVVWRPKFDRAIRYQTSRKLELELDLGRTAAKGPNQEPPRPRIEARLAERRGPLLDRLKPLREDLSTAADWQELELVLADHGLGLARASRGTGLVITDGKERVSASDVHRALSITALESRFGQTFKEHRERVPPPLVAGRFVENPTTTQDLHRQLTVGRAVITEPDISRLRRQGVDPQLLEEARAELIELRPGAYVSQDYLATEQAVFENARQLAAASDNALPEAIVAHVIRTDYPHLAPEQARTAFAVTTRGDLGLILGRPGAGKTTTLKTVAQAYEAAGYEIRGLAIAGKAAQVLEQETGIQSTTFARWSTSPEARAFRPGTVVVVDEAGMMDTASLAKVLATAHASKAKVILLGDPNQLSAIGAGDVFRGLTETFPTATLHQIRRQRHDWMRAASEHLSAGRLSAALDMYAVRGRVTGHDYRADAIRTLLLDYEKDGGPAGALIITAAKADARVINQTLAAANRENFNAAAGAPAPADAVYLPGDRVLFRRNDYDRGFRNGSIGQVEARAENGNLRIRLDDGSHVEIFEKDKALALGYAVTAYKAQGTTVDRAYFLATSGTNRHAALVALTRHRDDLKVYYDLETFKTGYDSLRWFLLREGTNNLARDFAGDQPPAPQVRITRDQLPSDQHLDRARILLEQHLEYAAPGDPVAVRELANAARQPIESHAAAYAHQEQQFFDPAVRLDPVHRIDQEHELFQDRARLYARLATESLPGGVEHGEPIRVPKAFEPKVADIDDSGPKAKLVDIFAPWCRLREQVARAPSVGAVATADRDSVDLLRSLSWLLEKEQKTPLEQRQPTERSPSDAWRLLVSYAAASPHATELPVFRQIAQDYLFGAPKTERQTLRYESVARWYTSDTDLARDQLLAALRAHKAHAQTIELSAPARAFVARIAYDAADRNFARASHVALEARRDHFDAPSPIGQRALADACTHQASAASDLNAKRSDYLRELDQVALAKVRVLATEFAKTPDPAILDRVHLEVLSLRLTPAPNTGIPAIDERIAQAVGERLQARLDLERDAMTRFAPPPAIPSEIQLETTTAAWLDRYAETRLQHEVAAYALERAAPERLQNFGALLDRLAAGDRSDVLLERLALHLHSHTDHQPFPSPEAPAPRETIEEIHRSSDDLTRIARHLQAGPTDQPAEHRDLAELARGIERFQAAERSIATLFDQEISTAAAELEPQKFDRSVSVADLQHVYRQNQHPRPAQAASDVWALRAANHLPIVSRVFAVSRWVQSPHLMALWTGKAYLMARVGALTQQQLRATLLLDQPSDLQIAIANLRDPRRSITEQDHHRNDITR